jgi:hypothetical protein
MGFEVISLKNFLSDNISAHTPVVAGSMKPPNISLVMGCPVALVSMVAATGCAAAVAVKRVPSAAINNNCNLHCMSVLQSGKEP